MPIHDWTRVTAGVFHSFHNSWISELKKALNRGVLPPGYVADSEQVTLNRRNADVLTLRTPSAQPLWPSNGQATATMPGFRHFEARTGDPLPRPRRLAVRHSTGHDVVALIEIVSFANKDRRDSVRQFTAKAAAALSRGVHLLVVDILPPGRHDRSGIHASIWQRFTDERYDLPADRPLTLATYTADPPGVAADVAHAAFGDVLPDTPLALAPGYRILVPLEAAYAEAWAGTGSEWRDVLEAP